MGNSMYLLQQDSVLRPPCPSTELLTWLFLLVTICSFIPNAPSVSLCHSPLLSLKCASVSLWVNFFYKVWTEFFVFSLTPSSFQPQWKSASSGTPIQFPQTPNHPLVTHQSVLGAGLTSGPLHTLPYWVLSKTVAGGQGQRPQEAGAKQNKPVLKYLQSDLGSWNMINYRDK